MSEQSPDPAQPPRLSAVPPGTVPPGSAAPEPGTSAALVPPPSAVPLSAAERAGTALRLRYRGAAASAREFELSAERFLYAFAHPQPETMKEHRAYIESRAWVPDGLTEREEKAVVAVAVFHHVVIGRSLKAVAKSLKFTADKADEAGDRAPRFYGWLAFFGLLALILYIALS